MIRLLVGKYTLEQKKVLYRALLSGIIESKCGEYRSRTVQAEIEKAAAWLAHEIKKEETGNAQNR